VTGEINGLYPTPVRLKLVAALDEPGRIYGEANEIWDKVTGFKVTSRVSELIQHQWAEAVPREGYRADWSPRRNYFRPADNEFGRAAIERGQR
jgi:hypothetical protein